jgi:hypothetical protein
LTETTEIAETESELNMTQFVQIRSNLQRSRLYGRRRMLVAAVAILAIALTIGAAAQAPARGASPKSRTDAGSPPARGASPARATKVDANMLQLMRGILYPASNVLFAAQDDLGKFPAPADPSVSPNPLTSTYGGWVAVENAALALSESANLVSMPGRMCSNGKPAPVQRADWAKYVQGLRDAARAAYKAAQSKNRDAMVDVAGTVSDACAACHDVYREKKGGEKDRCLP